MALAAVLGAAAVLSARAFGALSLTDFSYILVAGDMWISGLDPYGPAFVDFGAEQLPLDAIPFVYPPNWWIIAVSLAALKPPGAILLWKVLNLFAFAAACFLLVRTAAQMGNARRLWPACLFLVCASTSDIMAHALILGQTSQIVLLGFALLISGLTDKRRSFQVAGLAVLALKPQIGLIFLLLMATRRETRPAALVAALITAVACLPVLLTLGVEATVESARNLFSNLQHYGLSPWNFPLHTTGLPHLFAYLGINVHPAVALLAAWVIAEWLTRRCTHADSGNRLVSFWLISVAATLSIIPLHAYDFILFFPCLLLLPLITGSARHLLLLSLGLTSSAAIIAKILLWSDPSLAGWWIIRLQYDLLTAGGLALLAAAACHARLILKGFGAGKGSMRADCKTSPDFLKL